jgi:hypothetical protein
LRSSRVAYTRYVILRLAALALLSSPGSLACEDESATAVPAPASDVLGAPTESIPGPTVRMEFGGSFWASPWPAAHRVDLAGFPKPASVALVDRVVSLTSSIPSGWSSSSAIYFPMSAAIEPSAISLADTVSSAAPVQLVSIDPSADDFGVRYPVSVDFRADGGPFGSPNLLSSERIRGELDCQSGLQAQPAGRQAVCRGDSGLRPGWPRSAHARPGALAASLGLVGRASIGLPA